MKPTQLFALAALTVCLRAEAQGFTISWNDTDATGATKNYTLAFPDSVLASLAGAVAAVSPGGVAQPIRPAQYVALGDGTKALANDGSVITLGPNGEVFRDGAQVPGIAAQKVVVFGRSLYALGKTSPQWWLYGAGGWVKVTAFDATILK